MDIKINDQIFVNSKWYFDVKSVDRQDIKVRIKYFEGTNDKLYLYKVIKLPLTIFKNVEQHGFVIKATLVEKELKHHIGGLIDRLVKELDITKIVEEMGTVSSPGVNSTPGMTGSTGSGDISSVLPANSFGFEIVPAANRKKIKKMLQQSKNTRNSTDSVIKTPLLNLFKENVVTTDVLTSDNDYKLLVYQLLDYPADNEYDIKFINVINELRPSFLDTSKHRIVQYFKDLYKTNKTLIKDKCSEWFINNILILGEITDIE